jgi:hypothetical protein
MTDHPNAQIAREILSSLSWGDAGGLADAAIWHEPGTNRFSGKFQGRAAVESRMDRLREAGIGHGFDIHDVVANDEHAVALVHAHFTNARDERYDGPQVIVMHVAEGMPTEFWVTNQDQAVVDLILGS